MEDVDGGLKFDFEGGLDTASASAAAALGPGPATDAGGGGGGGGGGAGAGAGISMDVAASAPAQNPGASAGAVAGVGNGGSAGGGASKAWKGSRNFRQTVCRHWLRGLCMKGDFCGYLHQLDKARMPICRFFAKCGECREPDCVYKHSHDDIKECNMYKLGFCPNGSDCRYRHIKVLGPPPTVAEIFEKIQQMLSSVNGNSNRYSQQRHNTFNKDESQRKSNIAGMSQRARGDDSSTPQQQQNQHNQFEQANQNQTQQFLLNAGNGGNAEKTAVSAASSIPQGNSRYFIVKSSNKENLELSVQRGIWATHRNNEGKLNEAFDSCDNVILVFSVNGTRHFQGCARMTSKIGGAVGGAGWKHANGTSHYGRNFRLKWLKLCELSFHKTHYLRNPLNENLPVKISRDCQELEQSIGEQLVALLYLEPDSELMALACAAESKREEEKGQGTNSAHESEDPNIVPFEDNDDEQDEEESEDESSSQTRSASQGRGKGKGTWRGTMGRGNRIGSKTMGFHSGMIPGDAFSFERFGMGFSDGFSMPSMFTAQAQGRGFSHYGQADPRFGPSAMMFAPMEGSGPAPGIVFPARPNGIFSTPTGMLPAAGAHPSVLAANNAYLAIGAGRANFIGGGQAAAGGRSNNSRPKGMPYRLPQGGNNARGRKEQQRRKSENNNDKLISNMDQRGGGGRNWQRQPSVDASEAEREPETRRNVKFHQQDGYDYGNTSYNNNNNAKNDESESEDEAPRRSRHGEGKKRRRDWEGEEAEAEAEAECDALGSTEPVPAGY